MLIAEFVNRMTDVTVHITVVRRQEEPPKSVIALSKAPLDLHGRLIGRQTAEPGTAVRVAFERDDQEIELLDRMHLRLSYTKQTDTHVIFVIEGMRMSFKGSPN